MPFSDGQALPVTPGVITAFDRMMKVIPRIPPELLVKHMNALMDEVNTLQPDLAADITAIRVELDREIDKMRGAS